MGKKMREEWIEKINKSSQELPQPLSELMDRLKKSLVKFLKGRLRKNKQPITYAEVREILKGALEQERDWIPSDNFFICAGCHQLSYKIRDISSLPEYIEFCSEKCQSEFWEYSQNAFENSSLAHIEGGVSQHYQTLIKEMKILAGGVSGLNHKQTDKILVEAAKKLQDMCDFLHGSDPVYVCQECGVLYCSTDSINSDPDRDFCGYLCELSFLRERPYSKYNGDIEKNEYRF